MYRLLIVDDELYAVNGIKSGVMWELLEFTEVYEAYNVDMARAIMVDHEIDIVICDIEMPDGSGLELLGWMREQGVNAELIFLTCHADFRYAQKAIQLGSMNYLLKPVDFVELENIVLQATSKIKMKQEADQSQKELRTYYELWHKRKPLLLERFWHDAMAGKADERQLSAFVVDSELHSRSSFLPLLISIESWHKDFSASNKEIMEYALRNVAEEIILSGHPGIVMEDEEGSAIVIFFRNEPQTLQMQDIIRRCDTYITNCKDILSCSVSCYVGRQGPLSQFRQLYQELQYLERTFVTRSQKVVCYSEEAAKSTDDMEAFTEMVEWSVLLENGKNQQLQEEVAAKLTSLEKRKDLNIVHLQAFYYGMLQMFHYVLHKKRLVTVFKDEAWLLNERAATRSIRELQAWSERALEHLSHTLRKQEDEVSLTEKVKRYIHDNLDQDLNREQLAQYVYLNPGYLSRLFKKETGESITDYILRERMQQAHREIVHSDSPISIVAGSLGYHSLSYFGKMFKRIYGVSPQELRSGMSASDRANV
ncbi:helix-turn-helix domain-containing protein [Cohnella soli]|uniref:Helix-turn-helix domain-containing protein n=1 Tax=Cohnella soli TaxID=425005 RepID=A0ABW0HRN8_9BACL